MTIDSRDQPSPPEPLREVTESDHDRIDTSERDEGQSLVEANRQPFDSQGRPTDIDDPAGKWEVGPLRTRGQEYEGWTREETGAPQGMEYHVSNEMGNRWLDTRYVEDRNGEPTEVLVDAKDDYAQFIDPETGEWEEWWTGLDGALGQARDQVDVAEGRPVEWWCSQPEVAEKFNEAFEGESDLADKITAVHRPMPERDI